MFAKVGPDMPAKGDRLRWSTQWTFFDHRRRRLRKIGFAIAPATEACPDYA